VEACRLICIESGPAAAVSIRDTAHPFDGRRSFSRLAPQDERYRRG